jgi:hypothetical protein
MQEYTVYSDKLLLAEQAKSPENSVFAGLCGILRLFKFWSMVPEAGLEPARSKERQILNLLCLPISPLGLSAFTGKRKRRRMWRRDPESNRTSWICNPEHNRFAIAPFREAASLAESF